MKIRTFALTMIFIFAVLSTAFGEEEMNPLMRGSPLTLEESIAIALKQNPTLKGALGAIKEAKYRRLSAVSDFLPQVESQYSYTWLDEAPTMTNSLSRLALTRASR